MTDRYRSLRKIYLAIGLFYFAFAIDAALDHNTVMLGIQCFVTGVWWAIALNYHDRLTTPPPNTSQH